MTSTLTTTRTATRTRQSDRSVDASPAPIDTADTVFPAPGSTASARHSARHRRHVDHDAPMRISPYGPADEAPTTEFERTFRRRVAELGSVVRRGAPAPRRSTVTAVMTALRSGISADRLLAVARGLTPQDVADAYDHVARIRGQAHAALDRLIDDPTVDRFDAEADVIAPLMPQMVVSLRRLAAGFPDSLPGAIENLATQIGELDRSVDSIESRISAGLGSWRHLVGELDDGRNGGIQHHPCYRPRRVGDIVPIRLAYLLGDQKQVDEL